MLCTSENLKQIADLLHFGQKCHYNPVFYIGSHQRTVLFDFIQIYLKDLMHCFQAIKFFLAISLGENFPNSLMEIDAPVEFVFLVSKQYA